MTRQEEPGRNRFRPVSPCPEKTMNQSAFAAADVRPDPVQHGTRGTAKQCSLRKPAPDVKHDQVFRGVQLPDGLRHRHDAQTHNGNDPPYPRPPSRQQLRRNAAQNEHGDHQFQGERAVHKDHKKIQQHHGNPLLPSGPPLSSFFASRHPPATRRGAQQHGEAQPPSKQRQQQIPAGNGLAAELPRPAARKSASPERAQASCRAFFSTSHWSRHPRVKKAQKIQQENPPGKKGT